MMAATKNIMFVLLYLGGCMCVTRSLKNCEKRSGETLACKDKIPDIISSGVTQVFLEFDSANISFKGKMFNHASWGNITYLDINARYLGINKYLHFDLDMMILGRLKNLQELKIHGTRISRVNVESFRNISHLSVLEFSNCQNLECNTLVDSLLKVDITIDKLFINDVSTASENLCHIDDLFVKLLHRKNVEVLSLKYTAITVTPLQSTEVIRPKEIDISNVFISRTGLNLSSFCDMIVPLLRELVTLNASNIPMNLFLPDAGFFKGRVVTGCHLPQFALIELIFQGLENLYVNKMFTKPVVMNNTILNISDCNFALKRWHFRDNQLQYVNLTANLPINNSLIDIDFSNNEIRYMSRSFVTTLVSLEILNLGRNRLNSMETLPEFEDLFLNLVSLKYLSLAENKFSHLPQNLLRNNQALQSLDLSGNYLTTLTVSLKHNDRLLALDLSRNRIKFLENSKLGNAQMFSNTLSSSNGNPIAEIEIVGNPLECSCESAQFLHWLVMVRRQHSNKTYFCTMENEKKEEINEDTVRRANFLCYRTAVIVCSTVSIFVLTVFILLLIVFIRIHNRRQKQKNAERAFLNDMLKGYLGVKYLCHISYASEDERCVLDDICIKLGFALTTIVGTRRDFICIGDKDYRLGRPIVDEIFRCISESSVMLFVISESFCRSHWCEMELREARELDKPIILIFKEHVKEDTMSSLLQSVFNRMTRAKLIANKGAYELIPDWKNLGESIIKLATETYVTEKELF